MTRLALVAALLAACGGNNPPISGTVKGQSFTPGDTISGSVTLSGTTNTAGVVLITNVPSGVCAESAANKRSKSSAAFFFLLQDVNLSTFATTAPAAPGTYTISGSAAKSAIVVFATYDASCNQVSASSATGATGTVTLDSITNGAYAGSFDVEFDSNDHVTGTFSGTACTGLDAIADSTDNPTCI